MPEFILNRPRRAHPFYGLDDLAKGYVEAMFFTNGDTGDEREYLLNEWGVERLTKTSVANIAADCAAFRQKAGRLLTLAADCAGYDESRAGNDFWFTRQGHGVGFWDRRELRRDVWRDGENLILTDACDTGEFVGILGDLLSEAAYDQGEVYPQAYRGWIYHP